MATPCYKTEMTKTIEQWLLFTFEHGEFTPLSSRLRRRNKQRSRLRAAHECLNLERPSVYSPREPQTWADCYRAFASISEIIFPKSTLKPWKPGFISTYSVIHDQYFSISELSSLSSASLASFE